MARPSRTSFRCTTCRASHPKWVGRCPACHEWNTLEEAADPPPVGIALHGVAPPQPIGEVDAAEHRALPTGVAEVDRVLGGGLVPGSLTLLGGEPGIGKSTLLLQAAASLAGRGVRSLYVAAEESAAQVRGRAERLGPLADGLWLVAETAIDHLGAQVTACGASVVVVDSIQAVHTGGRDAPPGSVTQVRDCALGLADVARQQGAAVVLVGHVTKDGSLAGPRQLEHLVDSVLSFEGDRHHALRQLRAVKHRFGPTQELGLFEMTDRGLLGVPDASGLFLGDRLLGVAGSVVHPMIEGRRPLLVELQALVVPSATGSSRRSAEGVDPGRLNLLLAVLHQRLGVAVLTGDVYALAVGGARVAEPAADLPLALALLSATTGRPVDPHLVACGEVGLAGEVRSVPHLPRRLAEARRLGFRRAIVPLAAPSAVDCLELVPVRSVAEAALAAGVVPEVAGPVGPLPVRGRAA